MAKDIFIDVVYEVPCAELLAVRDPERFLIEKLRDRAEQVCQENGATLRADRQPEFHIRRGTHKITQVDHFLCASRWAVTAPESLEVTL